MNTIRKVATAVMALTITLTGAVLTTAPMTLAGSQLLGPSAGSSNPGHSRLTFVRHAGITGVSGAGADLSQS